jgi:hypothetical protein
LFEECTVHYDVTFLAKAVYVTCPEVCPVSATILPRTLIYVLPFFYNKDLLFVEMLSARTLNRSWVEDLITFPQQQARSS